MALRRPNWPQFILLLIVLTAAALRFWRLESLPPGLYHDEAYNGLDALSLLNGRTFPLFYEGWELYAQDAHAARPPQSTRWPVFFEGNYGREPLHIYLMALAIRFFGATPFAVRSIPALFGVLAVLATFLAARAMFPPDRNRLWGGELLPLVAAFSLAVLYPAVHFSRFGIRGMVMLPILTLAVYTFWQGWHSSGRRGDIWLGISGFLTGLGLYTFAAARLFPLVFIVFGLYMVWCDRWAVAGRLRGLALAFVAALLTAAPLLLFFARYPYFFVFRIAYVANRGAGVVEDAPAITWLLNVGRVMRGLFWLGETHLRHNLPGRPYMDPLQAGLFLAGLVQTIRHRVRPESVFLLIWLAVMLLPSILSGDAPHFGRLTGIAPAVAILIAAGATWIVEAVATRRAGVVWPLAITALLTLPSLTITTYDYFGRYANHPDLARDFYRDDWRMGRYAAATPADTVLYLTPAQAEMATIYFALGGEDRLRSYNGDEGLIPAGLIGQPALYLVRPDADKTLANLERYFPGNGAARGDPGDGFIPFHVPATTARILNPIAETAQFDDAISLPGWSAAQTPDYIDISLTWRALTALDRDYTAFVHLVDNSDTLVAQIDRQPAGFPTSDWRPGEIVADTLRLQLPGGLSDGEYRLMTGFYDLPTLELLGAPVLLDTIRIGTSVP